METQTLEPAAALAAPLVPSQALQTTPAAPLQPLPTTAPELVVTMPADLEPVNLQPIRSGALIRSAQMGKIVGALARAKQKFGPILKRKLADVKSKREGAASYQYRYADLAAVFEAVDKPLGDEGIAIVQAAEFKGARSVLITTVLGHTSDQYFENHCEWPLPVNATTQEMGGTETFGRRYAILGLLGVAPEDDPDAQAGRAAAPRSNGNGQAARPVVPMPERAAPPAPPALTIATIEPHPTAPNGPWWIVTVSDGRSGYTKEKEVGLQAEAFKAANQPIERFELEAARADRNGVAWRKIIEIVPVPPRP